MYAFEPKSMSGFVCLNNLLLCIVLSFAIPGIPYLRLFFRGIPCHPDLASFIDVNLAVKAYVVMCSFPAIKILNPTALVSWSPSVEHNIFCQSRYVYRPAGTDAPKTKAIE